jgi:CheY-like chemotaxis protein
MFNQYSYLYIEDDFLSREIMRVIMENAMGVERLTIFEDSTDFLERMRRLDQKPEVILLDIHMKPYNGFEMLRALRGDSMFAHAKIAALTASVMNEEIEELRQSGFDGAIGKPLSIKTFPELLTRIMDGEAVWHVA